MSMEDAAEDLDAGLARAIREYSQTLNRDEAWRKGPFLISDRVCEPVFEAWADRQESHWHLAWEPSSLEEDPPGTGFAWIYGDVDAVHETVVGYISSELAVLLTEMGAQEHVRFICATRKKLMKRHKEPDWSMVPDSKPLEAFPSVVMEVASKNESFAELKREIREWVEGQSLARLAIGVDVAKETTFTKRNHVRLRTFHMRRGDGAISDIVDMSNVKAAGEAVIRIAAEDIFGDEVPQGVRPSLQLDLYPLKLELERLMGG